jgi:subtilisin family serine protease
MSMSSPVLKRIISALCPGFRALHEDIARIVLLKPRRIVGHIGLLVLFSADEFLYDWSFLMKNILIFFHAFALAVLSCTTPLSAGDKEKGNPNLPSTATRHANYVPGMFIMKIKASQPIQFGMASVGIPGIDSALQSVGAFSVESFSHKPAAPMQIMNVDESNLARIIKVRYSANIDPLVLAMRFSQDPAVAYAEPYYIFPMNYIPNDAMLSQQWAIDGMHLKEAWDVTKGDSTIVIGDVDSGVDWTHPDLSLNIWHNPGEMGTDTQGKDKRTNGIDDDGDGKVDDWYGWDFIGSGSAQSPAPDNNPMDGAMAHGTWTTSCFAARTDNSIGIASSSFSAKVLPVKAAGDAASGIAAGYDGIIYAANMGCRIVNCSWGSYSPFIQALQDVISYAHSKGVLVVVSAGNDPIDNDYNPSYPSTFDHVLNVGSIEPAGTASTWCNYGTSVAVYAPGTSIYMAAKGGGYNSQQGTSFSAPLTAGVAALVFSVHPDWTPDQVAKQIRVTSDPFNTPVQSKHFGKVNAFKAVSLNKTLSDIPGIRVKSAIISTPDGTQFTAGGQSASVEVELENLLAPTSAAATATVDLDDTQITTTATPFALGVMPTFGTKNISFTVQLAQAPKYSEGYVVVRLRINDGSYVDYLVVRIPIYLQDAWHAALSFGIPAFSSLDALNYTTIWATANLTNQSQDLGIRSVDAGATWANVSGSGFPSGKGVYCVNGISSTAALVGTGPTGGAAEIYRTANGGQSWSGVSVSAITGFVDCIHMFDDQNGIFIGDPKSGIWGLGKTTNGGAAWTAITPTVPGPGTEAGWNNAADFVGDFGWFGTNNSKIYKTTDRGATWKSYATPSIHSVDMSFRDENVGMARFAQETVNGASTGTNALALTTDGGVTWKTLTTITTQASGAVAMERGGKRAWVMQNGNCFMSTNLGVTWTVQPVPASFGNLTVSDIYSNSSITDIWTAGLDVYRYHGNFMALDQTNAVDHPDASGFSITGLYPNPVSTQRTQAVVAFSLPSQGMTTLDLYNDSGRLLSRIMEASLAEGMHSVSLPLHGLPAGTYFCRLQSGSHSAVKQLVIIN